MGNVCLEIGVGHREIIVGTIAVTVVVMCICVIIVTLFINKKVNEMNQYHYYQEELFNALGSNIDDVFLIYDAAHNLYEYISPNFERSLGINRQELITGYQDLLNFVPTTDRQLIYNIIEELKLRKMSEAEFKFMNPVTGNQQWILLRVYPVSINQGKARYVSCIRDTTKEKAAQKVLEAALEDLQTANEAKKIFLSHISHELKTPINAIIGMTQIASVSKDDSDKLENCLKMIRFSSDKLLSMINNILDFSKIDNDKLSLENNPFSIRELITQYMQIAAIQAELSKQVFSYELTGIQDDYLIGDEMRVLQIISNCMSNAIKFTPAGGRIRFEAIQTNLSSGSALIRFIISDTGKGMSSAYLERIFIPFEQEDLGIAKKYGGTGLGMSITHSLIKLMNGSIQVTSTPNIGTTITIDLTFPLCVETDNKRSVPLTVKPPKEYDYSTKRVLIVEDNEINQEIIREFLKYIKLNVEVASDGQEAIRMFAQSDQGYYDMILMDLIMPEMDGYDTTRALRQLQHPDADHIPIIAMTADNFAEYNKSLEAGMNYHITKPLELENFYDIIIKVIDAGNQAEASAAFRSAMTGRKEE